MSSDLEVTNGRTRCWEKLSSYLTIINVFYFSTGAKVHQSQECTRIIEPGGVSYALESVGGLDGVTQDMKPLLEHAQNCYQQCVHLERVINKEESESSGGQYFPFIVCRKPPLSRNKSLKGNDGLTEAHNPRYVNMFCDFCSFFNRPCRFSSL